MEQEKSFITASWSKLMEDGENAAHMYLLDAIEQIDKHLGPGYAKQHPELIGAYMNAASRETHGSVIAKCILEQRDSIDELRETVGNSVERIATII
jgi:hypothetical protein